MKLTNLLSFIRSSIRLRLKRVKRSYSLYLFNKQTDNDIQSADVDLACIKGNHISVQKGSYISGDSEVGSYTYIGFSNLISKSSIGRYCSLASNVSIGHGEHPVNRISTSTLFIDSPYEVLTAKDCNIGNDVWIGVSCIIRRGVAIGDGAIIGANSFVNKDVPPFAIVAGSPAKIIRYRFTSEKIEKILASRWWDQPLDIAKKMINDLELDEENH